MVQLAVPRDDLPFQFGQVDERLLGQLVHAVDELGQRPGDHEVGAVPFERLHRSSGAGSHPGQGEPEVLAGQVGVLLRTGQRELLLDDLLGEYEPGVVVAGGADGGQRAQRVEPGKVRRREAPPRGVEPQRGRPGQDPDAMPGPDRVPVLDPLGVVPHPVAVDHPGAGPLGDGQHPPVDVLGHPADHPPRYRPEPFRPVLPDQFQVAADAAGRHDHHRRVQFELADRPPRAARPARGLAGLEDGPARSVHDPAGDGEVVDPVPEPERDQPQAPRPAACPHLPLDGRQDAGPGAR